MFMLAFVLGGLALAWDWSAGLVFEDGALGKPAPEVYEATSTLFGDTPWFTDIDSMYRDDGSLQVVTTLPDASDASVTYGTAIYE
jgi:hypothetical protein